MGFNPLNLEKWKMEEFEVAKFSPIKNDANAHQQKLFIPKLMPMISFGTPKNSTESLDKSIFINDPACKPSPDSTVQTQNFKTVPKPDNRKFARTVLTQGVTMQVEVKNGNPDEMYISTKVDPSSDEKRIEEYKIEFETEGTGTGITATGVPVEILTLKMKGKEQDQHIQRIK